MRYISPLSTCPFFLLPDKYLASWPSCPIEKKSVFPAGTQFPASHEVEAGLRAPLWNEGFIAKNGLETPYVLPEKLPHKTKNPFFV